MLWTLTDGGGRAGAGLKSARLDYEEALLQRGDAVQQLAVGGGEGLVEHLAVTFHIGSA